MTTDPVLRGAGRRETRERAVELGYEALQRGLDVDALLATLTLAPDDYTVDLLRWTEEEQAASDARIQDKATGWTLGRMPRLDLLIMRLAVAELVRGTTPRGVVLAEATELASRYSTESSGRFVNGVLSAIARDLDGGHTAVPG
ncbi:MAG: transcription antitermination factor NusB [Acidimicrobiales bacterium]